MKNFIVHLFVFCLSYTQGYSQIDLTIDLANQVPGVTVEEIIEPGRPYSFYLTNMIVKQSGGMGVYEVIINYEFQPPLALQYTGTAGAGTSCPNLLETARGEIINATDETEIKTLIQKHTKVLLDNKCPKSETLYQMVTRRVYSGVVNEGYTLIITVKRDDKTWIRKFRAEPKGKWLISYGLTFPLNVVRDQAYYTEQDTLPNRFFIREGNRTKKKELDFRPVPTVYYSWHKNKAKNWTGSLIAGLGLDLTEPVVTLGGNLMYHHNIGISLGLVLSKKDVLKERYDKDQVVPTALEFNDLHDRKYKPDLYFAVVFRFGENPFKKSGEKLEKPDTQAPTNSSNSTQ